MYLVYNVKDVPLVEFITLHLHAYQVRVTVGNKVIVIVFALRISNAD